MTPDPRLRVSDAASTIRVGAAELIADVIIDGIHECEEEGCSLTNKQQRVLMRNAVMAYATAVDEMQTDLRLQAKIGER